MDFQLLAATVDDIPGIANCAGRAFADDALEHAIFPRDQAPPGRNPGVEFRVLRFQKHLQSPERRCVVATVPAHGDRPRQIAGFAAWVAPHTTNAEQQSAEPAPDVPAFPGMDAEAAQYATEAIEKAKSEILGSAKDDVWYLASLAVDPDFRKRGLACKLVQWGLDQADKEGKAAYLESSPAAVGVYRRMGFQELGRLTIIEDDESHPATLMKREPAR